MDGLSFYLGSLAMAVRCNHNVLADRLLKQVRWVRSNREKTSSSPREGVTRRVGPKQRVRASWCPRVWESGVKWGLNARIGETRARAFTVVILDNLIQRMWSASIWRHWRITSLEKIFCCLRYDCATQLYNGYRLDDSPCRRLFDHDSVRSAL